jgi:hypothetical protein
MPMRGRSFATAGRVGTGGGGWAGKEVVFSGNIRARASTEEQPPSRARARAKMVTGRRMVEENGAWLGYPFFLCW